nr:histidine kinase N-terminal 7TM domain-containing protein [uncultured Deefgea sp.]
MNWPSFSLLLCTVLTLALAVFAAKRKVFPAQYYFVATLLGSAWWSTAAAIELLLTSPSSKVLFAQLAWIGIMAVPTFWAMFVWSYVKGYYQKPSWRWQLGLWLMPLVTVAIALSNEMHHWMYVSTLPISAEVGAAIVYQHGPWFYIAALFMYGYMTLSMLVLLNALARASRLHRRHYIGLAIAMAVPWLANAAHLTGLVTLFDFDPTPFSFLLMGCIFYWLVSHRQLFDLLPIAHDVLLDAMPDAVLVINEAKQIAQLNQAAQSLPNMPPNATGLPLARLEYLNSVLPLLWGKELPVEFEIELGDTYYDLRSVTVYYQQQAIGLLLVLRDITHQKLIQHELKQTLNILEDQIEANALLQQQLREEAIHDPLTGLHNRRFLDEIAPNLIANASRKEQPLSVVMLDLDHFKTINDQQGHAVGDIVLRHVAQLLQTNLRQSDYIFRIGGEEFLILMTDTLSEQAIQQTEVWRAALRQQLPQIAGRDLPVTFSAGIAQQSDEQLNLANALIQADQALYQAKAKGRNRSEQAPHQAPYINQACTSPTLAQPQQA